MRRGKVRVPCRRWGHYDCLCRQGSSVTHPTAHQKREAKNEARAAKRELFKYEESGENTCVRVLQLVLTRSVCRRHFFSAIPIKLGTFSAPESDSESDHRFLFISLDKIVA